MNFGKCQDGFGRIFLSKIDYNYFDVKLKVFKKVDNKVFRLVQARTVGEADLNRFMQVRNQAVTTEENFGT